MRPPADFDACENALAVPGRFIFSHRVAELLVDLLVSLVLLVFLLLNLVLVGSISASFFFLEKCCKFAAHPAHGWATLVQNRKRKKQEHWLRELSHWLSM